MLIEQATDCPNAPRGYGERLQISVRIFAGLYFRKRFGGACTLEIRFAFSDRARQVSWFFRC